MLVPCDLRSYPRTDAVDGYISRQSQFYKLCHTGERDIDVRGLFSSTHNDIRYAVFFNN